GWKPEAVPRASSCGALAEGARSDFPTAEAHPAVHGHDEGRGAYSDARPQARVGRAASARASADGASRAPTRFRAQPESAARGLSRPPVTPEPRRLSRPWSGGQLPAVALRFAIGLRTKPVRGVPVADHFRLRVAEAL